MPTQADDDSIIARLNNGDESALECLYGRYSPILYAIALRIVGDPRIAEEVLQDSFFQLWRKASQFDSARGSLIGWLLTIARYRAISRVRREKNERDNCDCLTDDVVLPPANAQPSALEQQIARQLVSAAMIGLTKNQEEAVTLAYFDGLTCEEIATHTNAPVGTVKTRIRTALRSMKGAISDRENVTARDGSPIGATLADILVTDQLLSRPCRRRNPQSEKNALHALGRSVATTPQQLIDAFLQLSIDLCGADTCGLSLLETKQAEPIFRWTNLAGTLKDYVGGTTPRNFSPCGVTLDRHAAQLFSYPGRYFRYFNDVDVAIVEGLVIPFHVGPKQEGTVWIVSHQEGTRFDSGDVRVMTGLAEFVGCALHLAESFDVAAGRGDSGTDHVR